MENDALITAIKENTAVMRELLKLERARITRSEWMTPEEVAQLIGLDTNTTTKYYRRQVSRAADRYGLRVTGNKKPRYWRADIIEYNRKLLAGTAVIPGGNR
ncbi:hypothetical protein [Flavilitoribacter nigricans]|uniref:Uncharacterized protein n=1 Tax=Flavilitoribacter nigricans (strain ATCC 23147 / DSM 23189 / NBRC 102662 / NCIMB 1420 / SS-2) TaxID=1122177 RepID=A0A2D0NCA9_FLAN2|nr:hypothetical protein [Flavilitoribacter nigricans]PHN06144.1 hypothetical protein CRP01_11205 [Flavilitoribacter nigricans DSM 23189 = NBRC 102662]